MFERLYHKGKSGNLYQWDIEVNGAEIITRYGLVDGEKLMASKFATPKNIGKKNETTAEAQALLEATAMHKFKLERKYSTSPEQAEEPLELPMLAKEFTAAKKIEYPLDLQPKLDGVRCIAKWTWDKEGNGSILLMSRSGKPYDVPHLAEQIAKKLPLDAKLDGEIYVHGLTFQEIVTLVKKNRPESIALEFHAYDCMLDGDELTPWLFRKRNLEWIFTETADTPNVKLVKTIEVADAKEQREAYEEFVSEGYEGAIARLHHGVYQFGYRSSELLKIKEFNDGEFPIVGAYEGVGKFAGCITWVCEAPNGKTFGVCPKGTLEEKKQAWKEWNANPEQFVKALYKVKYFGFTDEGIPRFPIGLGFRDTRDMSNPENGED